MADFTIELKKAPTVEVAALGPPAGHRRDPAAAPVPRDRGPRHVRRAPSAGWSSRCPSGATRRSSTTSCCKSGSYFSPSRDEEVLVNDAFARRHRIRVGDRIRLLLNDRSLELAVVGTAISSEFVYLLGPGSLVPDPEHFGVFYLKQRYLEEVFDFKGALQPGGRPAGAGAARRPEPLLERAERRLGSYGVFSTTARRDQVSNRFVTNATVGAWRSPPIVMPAIFLVVAALILGILMGRLVENQRTTLGTLKAAGLLRPSAAAHVLEFGLAVGLVGGVLGSGARLRAGRGVDPAVHAVLRVPRGLVNRPDPAVYAAGLLGERACALAGAARGRAGRLRLDPAEAMRPKPPQQGCHRPGAGRLALAAARPWLAARPAQRRSQPPARPGWGHRRGHGDEPAGHRLSCARRGLRDARDSVPATPAQRHRPDLPRPRGRAALRDARRLPGVDRAEPVLNVACTLPTADAPGKGITGALAPPDATLTVPRDLKDGPCPSPPGCCWSGNWPYSSTSGSAIR